MFEELKAHHRIVVTGPQRSGTRIAAKMIAADTGHRFVDEVEFGVFDASRWRALLDGDGIVVQCPTMLKDVVDDPPSGVYVVLMRRPLEDIHASEKRIGWRTEAFGHADVLELMKLGASEGDPAELKYRYWDTHTKEFPYLELDYAELERHPLFVAAPGRRAFGPLQTAP